MNATDAGHLSKQHREKIEAALPRLSNDPDDPDNLIEKPCKPSRRQPPRQRRSDVQLDDASAHDDRKRIRDHEEQERVLLNSLFAVISDILDNYRAQTEELDDDWEKSFREFADKNPRPVKGLTAFVEGFGQALDAFKRDAYAKSALTKEAVRQEVALNELRSMLQALQRLHRLGEQALEREQSKERRGRRPDEAVDAAVLRLAETYCAFFDPQRDVWTVPYRNSKFIKFATAVLSETLGPHGLNRKLSDRWKRLRPRIKPF